VQLGRVTKERKLKLIPYLTFNGQCDSALKFYERCLGGKTLMKMTYGESPLAKQMPPDWGTKILHATFAVGDQTLGAADALPERYQKPQGISVTLNIDTAAEADRIFNMFAENGTVQMPIQETFWATRFGMVVDRFGTPWMINCGKPQ
jgi:PhnB protein